MKRGPSNSMPPRPNGHEGLKRKGRGGKNPCSVLCPLGGGGSVLSSSKSANLTLNQKKGGGGVLKGTSLLCITRPGENQGGEGEPRSWCPSSFISVREKGDRKRGGKKGRSYLQSLLHTATTRKGGRAFQKRKKKGRGAGPRQPSLPYSLAH